MDDSILFEIFSGVPRGGPGKDAETRRAFNMLSGVPDRPRILDIGCGPGMQTVELAKASGGSVVGMDIYSPFLRKLRERAADSNRSGAIFPVCGSMFDLCFKEGVFDVIWSEGAIYIAGFEKGLREWKRLLKPGDFLVVTEVSWLKDDPPDELREFWESEYPGIQTVDEALAVVERCGLGVIGHFVLPEDAWWDDLYIPLEKRVRELRLKYKDDPETLEVLDMTDREIELYREYSDWYGYVFYIMRLPV